MGAIGFGGGDASIKVFIAHRPPLDEYLSLASLNALSEGEISDIGRRCGNHWRKIFNCYAKLIFAINTYGCARWQDYRDTRLLQCGSDQQLRFDGDLSGGGVSVICGKTYAQTLALPGDLLWLDGDFAISRARRLIVCPYFDYRQLSNVKIQRLSEMVQALL